MGRRIEPKSGRERDTKRLRNSRYRVLFYELHEQVPNICNKTGTMT